MELLISLQLCLEKSEGKLKIIDIKYRATERLCEKAMGSH